ncbi:Ig-like domain-containing protein [Planktothricoides raciborskii]|uniref:Ig-like domain-containing protein n=1 Tax=Planktothricoides raciborskii GIHE-MW2 TaxID=2792601 RepID=A0AAU8JJ58_9CYAN
MALIIGTLDKDFLQGTDAADEILGLVGDDTINGLSGDDTINGNEDKDLIDGGEGNDLLRGGQDNDTLLGNNGDDTTYGDKGNDLIFGDSGQDALFGGEGDDTLNGSTENDFLNGNEGADLIYGGQNDDTLRGGIGNDILYGDRNHDLIYGDKGADSIFGGLGDDTFVIGQGTGGPEITDADWLLDFGLEKDFIGLINGLKFEQLNIFPGVDEYADNIIIQNRLTGEFLAIIKGGVSKGITLNASNFVELVSETGFLPDTSAETVGTGESTQKPGFLSLVISNNKIAENSPNGTIVGTLSISGVSETGFLPDTSAETGESTQKPGFLLVDDAGGRFAIVGNAIVVANGGDLLDFETTPNIPLTVQVTTAAGLTFSQPVTVDLINLVNEENPSPAPTEIIIETGFLPDTSAETGELTQKPGFLSVAENSPGGTLVGTLSIPEGSEGATFFLVDDAGGRFVISETGFLPDTSAEIGESTQKPGFFSLKVAPGADINFETNPTIPIRVRVANANGQTLDQVLTVNVLNMPDELSIAKIAPVSTPQDTQANVPITIGDIEVATGQISITGSSSNIGLVPNSETGFLSDISAETGELTQKPGFFITGQGANRSLIITPTPGQSGTTEITLNLNDGSQTATQTFSFRVSPPVTEVVLSNSNIAEKSANGTIVGTLSTTGASETGFVPDTSAETGELTQKPGFLLVDDAGGRFAIVGNQIVVANGEDLLDFETTPNIPLTVQVTTAAGLTFSQPVTVDLINLVNEENPSPAPTEIIVSRDGSQITPTVAENSPGGTVVGTLSIPEGSEGATFFLVDDAGGKFVISPTTNQQQATSNQQQIQVAPGADINFETNPTIPIRVRAANANGQTLDQVLTVNVLNVPDQLSIAKIAPVSTPQDTQANIPITIGDAEIATGPIIITGSSSNIGLVPNSETGFLSDISAETGELTQKPGFFITGQGANRSLIITPTPGQSGTTEITLNLNDGSQTATQTFSFTVLPPPAAIADLALSNSSIPENSPNGTLIGLLSTISETGFLPDTSAETGESTQKPGFFSYTLLDDAGGRFAIFGNLLIVANGGSALDFEATPTIPIRIQVTTNNGDAFEKVLNIPLTDIANEENPGPPPTDIIISGGAGEPGSGGARHRQVAENSPGGTLVGTLSIPEGSEGATFSLLDDAGGKFVISETSETNQQPTNNQQPTTTQQLQVAPGAAIDFEQTPVIPIIVRATNANGQILDRRIELTVTNVPDQLTIEAIPLAVSTRQDSPISVAVNIGDSEILTETLTQQTQKPGFSFSSSNPALIPNSETGFLPDTSAGTGELTQKPGFSITGEGANRILTITPAAGQTGTAEITLTLNDSPPFEGGAGGVQTASQTFSINVLTPVGTPDNPLKAFLSKPLKVPQIQLTTNNQAIAEVSNPINGEVSLKNGEITFIADEGYVGPASFDFTIDNGQGEPTTLTANIEVTDTADIETLVAGDGGFEITGETKGDGEEKCVNISIVPAEDINGDGLPDLVVKDVNADKNFLIFGKEDGNDVDLTKDPAESGTGYRIFAKDPADAGDKPNYATMPVGDLNGDELEDVLFNSFQEIPEIGNSVPSYIVFGQDPNSNATPFLNSLLSLLGGSLPTIPPSNINVKNLGTKGFKIIGTGTFDQAGRPIIRAGDFNGDKWTDLLVKAPIANPNIPDYGPYYVLFGKNNNQQVDFPYLNNPAPQKFDLAELFGPPKVGFAITSAPVLGTPVVDFAGRDVLPTADINGDKKDDLLIGFSNKSAIGFGSNSAFVVFGKSDEQPIDLTNLAAPPRDPILSVIDPFQIFFPSQPRGFDITSNKETLAGRKISAGGDTNGDNLPDLVIEADPDPNSGSNKSYVVFGKNNSKTVNLDALGSAGYYLGSDPVIDPATGQEKINPATGKPEKPVQALRDFSSIPAGDINGDKKQDFLLIPGKNPSEIASKIYVIFGKEDERSINLNDLNPPPLTPVQQAIKKVFEFFGLTYPEPKPLGFAINNPAGLRNRVSASTSLSQQTSLRNPVSDVNLAEDLSNRQITPAGDVNGDGLDDVIIGPPKSDTPGVLLPGDAYVVFGKNEKQSIDVNLQNLGSAGFKINHSSLGDITNFSIAPGGDFNGDGLKDLIVSPPKADPLRASGPSYMIFGKSNAGPRDPIQAFLDPLGLIFPLPPPIALPTVDLANLGNRGFAIAPSGNQVTISLRAGKDINSDGFDDLTIETEIQHSNDKICPGPSYFVFGTPAYQGGQLIKGNEGNDNIAGTAAAEVLVGGRGNDVLSSGGGFDNISGDLGDDIIILNNVGFNRISGGSGSDVLRIDSTEDIKLDFSPFPIPSIRGIEQIDLTSAGNHTIKISGANLKTIPDKDQPLVVLANPPIVNELGEVTSEGDVVELPDFLSAGTEGGLNKFIFEDETKVVLVTPGVTVNFGGFNVEGSDENDLLTGTAKGDRLLGKGGNDVLIGGGGQDDLQGGPGDDVLVVSDILFKNASGGIGKDILRISGANVNLDLRAFPQPPISQISQIDLTGFGNNTLTLDTEDLTQITEDGILTVVGNEGDTVAVIGFVPLGTENGLNKFGQAGLENIATLLVDPAVTVTVLPL